MRDVGDPAIACPFLGIWPQDPNEEVRLRSLQWADPSRIDTPLAELNRRELYHLSEVTGHEGWDFQNPYVFASRDVLVYPSPYGTELIPTYGIGGTTTPEAVAMNVRATSGALLV